MQHVLSKVLRGAPEECWPYQGKVGSAGYPLIRFEGKQWLLHRLVYLKYRGPLLDGMVIMHVCENKLCLNPTHLRQDTQSSNITQACTTGVWRSGTTKIERHERVAVLELLRQGKSRKEVCKLFNVSNSTLSRLVSQAKEAVGNV